MNYKIDFKNMEQLANVITSGNATNLKEYKEKTETFNLPTLTNDTSIMNTSFISFKTRITENMIDALSTDLILNRRKYTCAILPYISRIKDLPSNLQEKLQNATEQEKANFLYNYNMTIAKLVKMQTMNTGVCIHFCECAKDDVMRQYFSQFMGSLYGIEYIFNHISFVDEDSYVLFAVFNNYFEAYAKNNRIKRDIPVSDFLVTFDGDKNTDFVKGPDGIYSRDYDIKANTTLATRKKSNVKVNAEEKFDKMTFAFLCKEKDTEKVYCVVFQGTEEKLNTDELYLAYRAAMDKVVFNDEVVLHSGNGKVTKTFVDVTLKRFSTLLDSDYKVVIGNDSLCNQSQNFEYLYNEDDKKHPLYRAKQLNVLPNMSTGNNIEDAGCSRLYVPSKYAPVISELTKSYILNKVRTDSNYAVSLNTVAKPDSMDEILVIIVLNSAIWSYNTNLEPSIFYLAPYYDDTTWRTEYASKMGTYLPDIHSTLTVMGERSYPYGKCYEDKSYSFVMNDTNTELCSYMGTESCREYYGYESFDELYNQVTKNLEELETRHSFLTISKKKGGKVNV